MRKKFAVIGSPVKHSLSPIIHQLFAKQFAIELQYSTLEVTPQQLPAKLHELKQQGFSGINVTSPLKEQAFLNVDFCSTAAKQAQAVNTISFDYKKDILYGDNTDGVGLTQDLTQNYNLSLAGKNILILGAGGACKGVLAELSAQAPQQIFIANRTYPKAAALAVKFANMGWITAIDLNSPTIDNLPKTIDLLINATTFDFAVTGESSTSDNDDVVSSAINGTNGLFAKLFATGNVPSLANTFCYDMNYNSLFNGFKAWASNLEATTITNGLGMLIEQAATSFYLWHGLKPNTKIKLNIPR